MSRRPIKSGIYTILCTVNKKKYIGSSINIDNRWYMHRFELKRNNHANYHLQRAWNKYGPDAFEWSVLETIVSDELTDKETGLLLVEREQYYIDLYMTLDQAVGFNLDSIVRPNMYRSYETRLKLSGKTDIYTIEQVIDGLRADYTSIRPSMHDHIPITGCGSLTVGLLYNRLKHNATGLTKSTPTIIIPSDSEWIGLTWEQFIDKACPGVPTAKESIAIRSSNMSYESRLRIRQKKQKDQKVTIYTIEEIVTGLSMDYKTTRPSRRTKTPITGCGLLTLQSLYSRIIKSCKINNINKKLTKSTVTILLTEEWIGLTWEQFIDKACPGVPTMQEQNRIRGRCQSAETRAKSAASRTGKYSSAESKARNSASHMGKHHSTETKAKVSATIIDKKL